MRNNHENSLLEEYFSQVDNVLTENEKKLYDQYSFYHVYEVEIAGCNPCDAPVYCCILIACLSIVSMCIPTSVCGFNWAETCCFGCTCFDDCRACICTSDCCYICNESCCVCNGISNCCYDYHGDNGENAITGSCYCCDVISGKSDGGDCSGGCECSCCDGGNKNIPDDGGDYYD